MKTYKSFDSKHSHTVDDLKTNKKHVSFCMMYSSKNGFSDSSVTEIILSIK